MEATRGAHHLAYPPPRAAMFLSILVGYSRMLSSPLSGLRPKLKTVMHEVAKGIVRPPADGVQKAANEN